MKTTCYDSTRLSQVTKKYLMRYDEILDTMICGMTEAQLGDSISSNFIVQMIPHHQAAIAMSKSLLQITTDVPLQEIARNIVTSQTRSIENMQKALACCQTYCSTDQDLYLYQRRFTQITQTMFREMHDAGISNDVNRNFIREMIPHHLGAVRMSKNALSFAICPQLVPILQAIITSQEEGICQMEALYRCR